MMHDVEKLIITSEITKVGKLAIHHITSIMEYIESYFGDRYKLTHSETIEISEYIILYMYTKLLNKVVDKNWYIDENMVRLQLWKTLIDVSNMVIKYKFSYINEEEFPLYAYISEESLRFLDNMTYRTNTIRLIDSIKETIADEHMDIKRVSNIYIDKVKIYNFINEKTIIKINITFIQS